MPEMTDPQGRFPPFARLLGLFAFAAAAPVAAATADDSAKTEHFFPLIADGGGFQSRLFVTNVSDTPNRCALSLHGPGLDAGVFQPDSAVTTDGAGAAVDLAEAGAGVSLASAGGDALTFGYMKLDCDEPAAARVLLSLEGGGTLLSLATLESAAPGTSFQFPALSPLGRLAMVFSNEAGLDAACAAELEDEAGASLGGGSFAVAAESTVLQFLDELIPPPVGFDAGKVRVSCGRDVAAVALPLDGAVFTAFSATPLDRGGSTESSHILPLVWDGGGFRSRLLLTNLSDTANSCSVDLRGGRLDAGRFEVPAGAAAAGSSVELELAAKDDLASLSSLGVESLAYGYAAVECEGPVAARNVITMDTAGNPVGMAVVSGAQSAGATAFPVVPGLGRMALAVSNDGESAVSCAVEPSAGGEARFPVAGGSTEIRFLDDLFPPPDDFPGGMAKLTCGGDVAATSLLIGGDAFAAVPPIVPAGQPVSAAALLAGLNDGSWLERQDPARADRLKALPWFADGLNDSERRAAEDLISLVVYGRFLLFDALLRKSWVVDGLTRDEAAVAADLSAIGSVWRGEGEPDLQALRAAAVEIPGMPFLDSVGGADATAVLVLRRAAGANSSAFLELMDHPTISDGITDQEAKIVTVLDLATHHADTALNNRLLDDPGRAIESRIVRTPLSGDIELAIIRTGTRAAPIMDLLEYDVRAVEEFMGAPFPTSYVALLLLDLQPPVFDPYSGIFLEDESWESFSGANFVTHIGLGITPGWNPDYHVELLDGGQFPEALAEEIAHYYWSGPTGAGWVYEGVANFMRLFVENARVGARVERPTTIAGPSISCDSHGIAENDRRKDPSDLGYADSCDYYLGEQLFLDLYLTLGADSFRTGLRDFFRKTELDERADGCGEPFPDVCRLEASFKAGASAGFAAKVDEVLDRWYRGVGAASPASLAGLERGAELEERNPALVRRIKVFLPWVADGVDDAEREAAELIVRAAWADGYLIATLLRQSWVRDGITRDEAAVVERLMGGCVPVGLGDDADVDLDNLALPSCPE